MFFRDCRCVECTSRRTLSWNKNRTLYDTLCRYMRTVSAKKKGQKREATRIRAWMQHPLADKKLCLLNGRHFIAYMDKRLSEGAAASTVRNELAIISHLFSICIKRWGVVGINNPILQIELPSPARGRQRRLAKKEELMLLDHAERVSPILQKIVVFTLETTMRRGELTKIEWRDVNMERRTILLRDTKNGDARTVPLSSKAADVLREIPRRGRYVFNVKEDWITHAFKRACDNAGIHDLRFHDLRHEATSRLVELQRFNMMEVALITGHKTLQMLQRYTHLNAATLVSRLD